MSSGSSTALFGSIRKRHAETSSIRRIKSDPFCPAIETSPYSLLELRRCYDLGATNATPGSINHKVTEELIRESIAGWQDVINRCLKNVSLLVRQAI